MAPESLFLRTSELLRTVMLAMLFLLRTQAQSREEQPVVSEWLKNVPKNTRIHFNAIERILDWHSGIVIDLIFDTPRPNRLSILIGDIDHAQPHDRDVLKNEGHSSGVFIFRGRPMIKSSYSDAMGPLVSVSNCCCVPFWLRATSYRR